YISRKLPLETRITDQIFAFRSCGAIAGIDSVNAADLSGSSDSPIGFPVGTGCAHTQTCRTAAGSTSLVTMSSRGSSTRKQLPRFGRFECERNPFQPGIQWANRYYH